MNILVINWKDPSGSAAGGSEVYVSQVARVWSEQGHNVTLFVPQQSGRAALEQLDGVTYTRAGNIHTVFAYARLFLERQGHRFDAVVEFVSVRPFLAHHVVGDRSTTLVHHIAGGQWKEEMQFPLNWMGHRLFEPSWLRRMMTGKVVAVSASTARDLERHGIQPIAIVPPGCSVSPSQAPRRMTEAPRLAFVGRLMRYKRPIDAIRAFELVHAAIPSATLDVVGAGYLLKKVRSMSLPGVHVHGFVEEAEKNALLARTNLLLTPGTREGWGIVAMEAAAHGVPAVAYDVPGLRDAVVDGETGMLVAPTPEALAEAAIALLRDPQRWEYMSRGARLRAAGFSWQRTADALLAACTGGAAVDLTGRADAAQSQAVPAAVS